MHERPGISAVTSVRSPQKFTVPVLGGGIRPFETASFEIRLPISVKEIYIDSISWEEYGKIKSNRDKVDWLIRLCFVFGWEL